MTDKQTRKPLCGAMRTRGRGICHNLAGWGTSHVGRGRCKHHTPRDRAPARPIDCSPGKVHAQVMEGAARRVRAWIAENGTGALPPELRDVMGGGPDLWGYLRAADLPDTPTGSDLEPILGMTAAGIVAMRRDVFHRMVAAFPAPFLRWFVAVHRPPGAEGSPAPELVSALVKMLPPDVLAGALSDVLSGSIEGDALPARHDVNATAAAEAWKAVVGEDAAQTHH